MSQLCPRLASNHPHLSLSINCSTDHSGSVIRFGHSDPVLPSTTGQQQGPQYWPWTNQLYTYYPNPYILYYPNDINVTEFVDRTLGIVSSVVAVLTNLVLYEFQQ